MHAAVRLADFVGTDVGTNIDMRDMVAVNMVLSGADILFVEKGETLDAGSVIRLRDTSSNIVSKMPVLEAGGAGIPKSPTPGSGEIKAPGEVWGWFGNYVSGAHPAEQLAGKVVAIEGCGDSAKVTAKLLLGQGPSEAYHGLSVNQMRPARIVMIASELGRLGNKAAFQAGVRSMYAGLSTYMPDGGDGNYALIEPVAGKADLAFGFGANLSLSVTGREPVRGLDMIIRARGLTDPVSGDFIREFAVGSMRQGERRTDRFGTTYAPYSSDSRTAGIGPFAQLGVNSNAGVPENTASVWANSAAITRTAREWAITNRSRNGR